MKNNVLLVTGSTGAVGQCLVPVLEANGFELVHIVRAKGVSTPGERLAELLGDVYFRDGNCCAGDITKPLCGVSEIDIARWKGKVDGMLHMAGSISFEDTVPGLAESHNTLGTENAISLAKKLKIPEFHYMSTAYVAGKKLSFRETDTSDNEGLSFFNNIYEYSKAQAEKRVREQWNSGLWSIYRMAIMIGDSETAVIPLFTGYYGFFTPFWGLYQSLLQKWERSEENCRERGILVTDDSQSVRKNVVLPITIKCSSVSTLNLVPSDWLASTMVKLLREQPSGKIYHLVHPTPPKVEYVIRTSLRHIGFSGFFCSEEGSLCVGQPKLEPLQRLVSRGIEPFLPYVTHGPVFDCSNVTSTLGDKYVFPPRIDGELLGRMLTFAMKSNFGRK